MAPSTTTGSGTAADEVYLITAEGRERLERQVAELRALRDEESALDPRLTALARLLERTRVVDAAEIEDGVVALGSTVELRDEERGRVDSYLLTGMHDAAGTGSISIGSPVGRAVIGRRPGETVEVELPGGRSRRLTVVASRIAPLDDAP